MRQYDYVKDWDPPYDPTVPPSGGSIRGRLQEDPFGPPSSSSESESEDGDEGSEYHPSDYEMSDNDLSEPEDSGYEESESKLLDQPLNIAFKRRDPVWIKMQGKWYHGKVMKVLRSAKRPQVDLYTVFFRGNLKANLTPIDGTMKPDTPEVRDLLRAGKWI